MAFTIHGLDEKIEERLTERARGEHKSKNTLVKELLARALGMASNNKDTDDYREFVGLWTEENLRWFENRQAENSRVDPDDWR
jgi:hypothetical protein